MVTLTSNAVDMKTKSFSIIIIFIFFNLASWAQSNSKIEEIEQKAVELAEAQLIAYNNRDIDAFLEPYSDSVKIYNFPNEFQYQGKDKMRVGYADFFQHATNLHCEVVSRIVLGNKVIDEEKVTGFSQNKDDVLYAIAIYTIRNGKIAEVRFLRK